MISIETLLLEENQEVFQAKYAQLLASCKTPEERNFIKSCLHAKVYGGVNAGKTLAPFKALPFQDKFAEVSLKAGIAQLQEKAKNLKLITLLK